MIRILACLLFGLLLISGCGEKSDDTEGKTVLTYWRHFYATEDKAVRELIEKFEKKYPDITINYQSMPYQGYREKLFTSLQVGKGPDIMNVHNSWVYPFVKAGIVKEIPAGILPSEEIKKQFIQLIDSFSINGVYYGLPIGGGCLALYINTDHLKDAGLKPDAYPGNWEELEKMALKLTKKEGDKIIRTGFACGGRKSQSWNYLVEGLFRQNGSGIIDKDHTRVLWDSAKGIEAFTYYLSFITKHKIFSFDFEKPVNIFMEGSASMIVDLNVIIQKLKEQAPNIKYSIYQLPLQKEKATYGSCWGNCVTTTCTPEKAEAAFTFMTYLASEESARFWTDRVGELPLYRSVLTDEQFRTAHKKLLPFIISMEYAYSSMKKDESAYKHAIVEAIEKVIQKNVSPEQALKEAAAKVNTMLKER
ncbi:ABC transporter substrate-binding protein [Planctomycetota bacterium]